MRKAYTTAQKQEAVALARVMGAEAAGKQLGIDPRTIVKWVSQAGDRPAEFAARARARQEDRPDGCCFSKYRLA